MVEVGTLWGTSVPGCHALVSYGTLALSCGRVVHLGRSQGSVSGSEALTFVQSLHFCRYTVPFLYNSDAEEVSSLHGPICHVSLSSCRDLLCSLLPWARSPPSQTRQCSLGHEPWPCLPGVNSQAVWADSLSFSPPTVFPSLVSSANFLKMLIYLTTSSMSLMKMMNSNGPNTLPCGCGTPDSTSSHDENFPFRTTLCLLPSNQLSIH